MFSQNKHRAFKGSTKRGRSRLLLWILVALLLLVLLLFALEKYGVINLFTKPVRNEQTTQPTSDQPTAQSNFKTGDTRIPTAADKNIGTVTDNNGVTQGQPPQSQWTTSTTGNITVYIPAKESILKSGDTISGTAKTPTVSYRLIDNVSGQISQGTLQVVNGTFSGTFNFVTKGTQGQVDVYNQAYDGTESNNVAIPVRF